ncbi:Hypothetical predicted protein [Paramuricea clavata]|uniref:Uncharacterized protein n=1 Tax=Paramuricea clavata TaxID=317549 RepID=A0A7D9JNS3_PARCT|nr:Hypothetical predicted protein [Paramuricea clavata]
MTCANNGHIRASLRRTSDNNPARNLSVLYANARSIVNKTTKLSLEINAEQFDVVILTETHLDNTIKDSEIFPNNFTMKLLFLGDFNLADVDWINIKSQKDTPLHNLLIEIIHHNFLTQMLHQPTRNKNISDLILTTSVDYVQDVEVEENLEDFRTMAMDRVVHDELSNVDCADDEIESYLKILEANKSPGPDTISPRF